MRFKQTKMGISQRVMIAGAALATVLGIGAAWWSAPPAVAASPQRGLGGTMPAIVVSLADDSKSLSDADKAAFSKIIGPERTDNNCASCHALEVEAWQQTKHYATEKTRHRDPRATEILKNMGLKSMKRDDVCYACHYTPTLDGDKIKVEWGVSCESCHAPGRDWNNIHNKVGGDPGAVQVKWGAGQQEDAAQRAARLNAAASHGMINSIMLYELAVNCFKCHTVPNEKLVNTGKHKAGSDFELASWSQGEIRHSFVSSPGALTKPTNRPATPEHRRMLYIVGAMVDLETSLRNLAAVKENCGDFHKAMTQRVNACRARISAILQAVDIPELQAAIAHVPENIEPCGMVSADVADAIGSATRQFVKSSDGKAFAAIDSQIPTELKGKVYKE